jgi:Skp family chaperone for outer membrane proteins
MKKILFGSAIAALTLTLPAAAPAQQTPAATIVIVDTGRILQECNACRAAQTQLQSQVDQFRQRETQLGQPLQTEEQALQAAVNAAQGRPDAALQQRINTFQTNRQNAQRELQSRQAQLERNRAFVVQQVDQRLVPIINQVLQQRGATIVLDRNAALAFSPALDATNAVLATLNQQLPSVNVNAPAQAAPAPAAQPAQQQPQRPRPTGR